MVTFGAPRLHFGRSWELLGSLLGSLGLILGASGIKMLTLRDQADIGKHMKKFVFSLISEGWRLTDALSGSLWKLRRKLLAWLLAG